MFIYDWCFHHWHQMHFQYFNHSNTMFPAKTVCTIIKITYQYISNCPWERNFPPHIFCTASYCLHRIRHISRQDPDRLLNKSIWYITGHKKSMVLSWCVLLRLPLSKMALHDGGKQVHIRINFGQLDTTIRGLKDYFQYFYIGVMRYWSII